MRDEDNGLIMRSQDILKELTLGFWIQCTRSLIKKHDAAIAQQTSGYGNTLCLSFTQTSSLLAANRIESLWQFHHKVGTTRMQGCLHLLISCIQLA